MAAKVYMEALSPTMEEGQVVKWHKAQGDAVAEGDVLADIETDKATMELVARGGGVLRAVLAGEGAVVPVGEVIGVIAGADEDVEALLAGLGGGGGGGGGDGDGGGAAAEAVPPGAGTGEASSAEEAARPGASEASGQPVGVVGEASAPGASGAPVQSAGATVVSAPGRVKASPVARRLASEAGLDLRSVAGSGPSGRIVKRDVEAAADQARQQAEVAASVPAAVPGVLPPVPGLPEPGFTDIPLSQMRKTVARRLTESLGPIPHFFLTVDVDMARALEARRRINQLLEAQGAKASLNDLVIKAAAAALVRHPDCNAWWRGDSIRRFERVHMGVAVAVPDGLTTPVVRDAHVKGLARIAAEVREMAGRAREKKLKPEEYTGSTFSISNLGMFGIEEFTAVINPPEAGILAVGAVEERPIAQGGDVVVRPRMRVTMSCDHRVIDGAQGARFLATLKTFLEEPAAILV